jgi:hypothetical protein
MHSESRRLRLFLEYALCSRYHDAYDLSMCYTGAKMERFHVFKEGEDDTPTLHEYDSMPCALAESQPVAHRWSRRSASYDA